MVYSENKKTNGIENLTLGENMGTWKKIHERYFRFANLF